MHRKKTVPIAASNPHHRRSNRNRNEEGALGPMKMTGLFFLFLLTNAYAINLPSKDTPSDKGSPSLKELTMEEKQELTEHTYQDVCTNTTFATYNKPNITLGAAHGKLLPKSCMDGNTAFCRQEQQLYSLFKPNNQYVDLMRNKVAVDRESWLEDMGIEFAKIVKSPSMASISEQQIADFLTILPALKRFVRIETTAKHANDAQGGRCGEHTFLAISRLLHTKIQYGLPMNLAFVKLSSSTSKEGITDHDYLLLDSETSEVQIFNNEQAVDEALAKIKKGKICDPWNRGYYRNFQTDDSGFYKKTKTTTGTTGAGWNNLEIINISLNFKGFNALPREAQNFICKELQKMGLDVEPKGTCAPTVFKKPNKQKKKKSKPVTSTMPKQDL